MIQPHNLRTLVAAALVVGSALSVRTLAADPPKRPNILFIFSDDHAYQAISAYGSKVNTTPNIDRLARDGMVFDNCFVTNSICGPMRAVIQTGKYSHINGMLDHSNGNRFNGGQWTFPKVLREAGYATAVIGKWHLGEHQAPQGYDYSEVLIGQGTYYNPAMLRDADGTGDDKQRRKIQHTGYTTDIIADRSLWWLKEGRDKTKPFLLMCQNKAPHREWSPGPAHLKTYGDTRFTEPETLLEKYDDKVAPRQTQQMTIARHMSRGSDLKLDNWAPGNLNPTQRAAYIEAFREQNEQFDKNKPEGDDFTRWAYQRYMRMYLACVASVDDNVGRILDYLDEAGLAENTIVIYCSDQGFYLGEHGWYDKRWVYEQSLRTPLLVRWPGVIKPETRRSEIVSPVDFAATFLDLAGIADKTPDDLQGRSIVPFFKGETPANWRKIHYYHYYEFPGAHAVRRHYAVVDGRYKLVHFYGKDLDVWELIDLKADPLEQVNFYNKPEYAEVQKQLHEELAKLRTELKVPDELKN